MAATAKVWPYKKAPAHITLLGDKQRPESAEHVIEFPGGAIAVTRTSEGNYWAHIIVNHKWADSDQEGTYGAIGEVVDSRIGHASGVDYTPDQESIDQIAVLIKPTFPGNASHATD